MSDTTLNKSDVRFRCDQKAVQYFIVGKHPVKITYEGQPPLEVPIKAELYDYDQEAFISDLSVLNDIVDRSDTHQVGWQDYCRFCLSRGITPV